MCCIYEFSAGATFEVVWLILRGAAGYAVVGFLCIVLDTTRFILRASKEL